MERELLEAILKAIEALKAENTALRAEMDALRTQVETSGKGLEEINAAMERQRYQQGLDAFSGRHGKKFDPVIKGLKIINGEDYDPVRNAYEYIQSVSETEGFDEDATVDKILADTVTRLNEIKGMIPEAAVPAVEAAEEAIQEAAIINDSEEDVQGEERNEAFDSAPEEWSAEMLEKEKPVGHRLF